MNTEPKFYVSETVDGFDVKQDNRLVQTFYIKGFIKDFPNYKSGLSSFVELARSTAEAYANKLNDLHRLNQLPSHLITDEAINKILF